MLTDGWNGVGINDFGGGSRGLSLLCGADIDVNGWLYPLVRDACWDVLLMVFPVRGYRLCCTI